MERQSTIAEVNTAAYAWRVVSDYTGRDRSGETVDAQPVVSLEFKRHGETYWHTAESWDEETGGRPVPGAALRLALAHNISTDWI